MKMFHLKILVFLLFALIAFVVARENEANTLLLPSVKDLPREILMKIFFHLDIHSLIRILPLLSHHFHDYYLRQFPDHLLWTFLHQILQYEVMHEYPFPYKWIKSKIIGRRKICLSKSVLIYSTFHDWCLAFHPILFLAKMGHLPLTEYLLQSDYLLEPIGFDILEKALILAWNHGHVRMIDYLLSFFTKGVNFITPLTVLQLKPLQQQGFSSAKLRHYFCEERMLLLCEQSVNKAIVFEVIEPLLLSMLSDLPTSIKDTLITLPRDPLIIIWRTITYAEDSLLPLEELVKHLRDAFEVTHFSSAKDRFRYLESMKNTWIFSLKWATFRNYLPLVKMLLSFHEIFEVPMIFCLQRAFLQVEYLEGKGQVLAYFIDMHHFLLNEYVAVNHTFENVPPLNECCIVKKLLHRYLLDGKYSALIHLVFFIDGVSLELAFSEVDPKELIEEGESFEVDAIVTSIKIKQLSVIYYYFVVKRYRDKVDLSYDFLLLKKLILEGNHCFHEVALLQLLPQIDLTQNCILAIHDILHCAIIRDYVHIVEYLLLFAKMKHWDVETSLIAFIEAAINQNSQKSFTLLQNYKHNENKF